MESCFNLLRSLGLLDPDFSTVNVGRLDSVSAKAVAFEARELSCFFRDALVFMLLLELRESSLSELHIRVLTRYGDGDGNGDGMVLMMLMVRIYE